MAMFNNQPCSKVEKPHQRKKSPQLEPSHGAPCGVQSSFWMGQSLGNSERPCSGAFFPERGLFFTESTGIYTTWYTTGWWFGFFFTFPYSGNNNPNWLFFQRGWNHQPDLIYNDVPMFTHFYRPTWKGLILHQVWGLRALKFTHKTTTYPRPWPLSADHRSSSNEIIDLDDLEHPFG